MGIEFETEKCAMVVMKNLQIRKPPNQNYQIRTTKSGNHQIRKIKSGKYRNVWRVRKIQVLGNI